MGISNKLLVGLAAILGLGILAKREKVGTGLGELGMGLGQIGVGLFEVGVAPFKSIGLGLGYAAGGMTAFATSLGDIGKGIGKLLEGLKLPDWVPSVPGMPGIPTTGNGNGPPLIACSGDSQAQITPGGGGNVLKPYFPLDVGTYQPIRTPIAPGYTPPPTGAPGGSTKMRGYLV